jgi:hypothetical protein
MLRRRLADDRNTATLRRIETGDLMRANILSAIICAFGALLLSAPPADAQSPRTWVSALGDDADPCSRVAPCRTYAGAHSKTAAGGEISVIDTGSFAASMITKSISIIAAGVVASTPAGGGPGITINAGPTDVVLLDGLTFEGHGSGTVGIRIVSAGVVHIRRCLIRGFQGGGGSGIEIAPTTATKVFVSDCAITSNSGGVAVKPSEAGSAQVFLDRVQLASNGAAGARVEGRAAILWLNQSVVAGNGTGLETAGGAKIISFGNNAIAGNATNGSPSETLALK